MFFCSLNWMLFAYNYAVSWGRGEGGPLFYRKCHTRQNPSLPHNYRNCFVVAKTLSLYVCMFCVRRTLCCFYGIIASVVDCRKSIRSYNMESRFAEQRQQYSIVQYSIVQYSIVQYSIVQYSIVQYSIVQYLHSINLTKMWKQ